MKIWLHLIFSLKISYTTISYKTQLQLFFYIIHVKSYTLYSLLYSFTKAFFTTIVFSIFYGKKKHNKAQFVNKFRHMWRDISCIYLLQALYCSKTLYSKSGKKRTFIEWRREKNILFFLNKHINISQSLYIQSERRFFTYKMKKSIMMEREKIFLFI